MWISVKCDDAPDFIDFDQVGVVGMVVRMKKERDVGAGTCMMPGPKPLEVDAKHRVAIHDEEFRLEVPERGQDGARRSSGFAVVDQPDGNR